MWSESTSRASRSEALGYVHLVLIGVRVRFWGRVRDSVRVPVRVRVKIRVRVCGWGVAGRNPHREQTVAPQMAGRMS